MTGQEAFESIELRFKSGNDVPVTRAQITREEWSAICNLLDEASDLAKLVIELHGYGA